MQYIQTRLTYISINTSNLIRVTKVGIFTHPPPPQRKNPKQHKIISTETRLQGSEAPNDLHSSNSPTHRPALYFGLFFGFGLIVFYL